MNLWLVLFLCALYGGTAFWAGGKQAKVMAMMEQKETIQQLESNLRKATEELNNTDKWIRKYCGKDN